MMRQGPFMEKSSENELNDKICLVFDATNRWIIAGLFGPLESEINIEANRDSFKHLSPILSDLLKKNGVKKPDWIVTTIGPGSFTGTKISVTAARTMSSLWGIPVTGVDSLTFYMNAINNQKPAEIPTGVLLDAKQKKVYAKLSGGGFSGDEFLEMSGSSENILLDIEPDKLFNNLKSDYRFFADDPETIYGYSETKLQFEISQFPEIRARYLYETGLAMGGIKAAKSCEHLIPLYLRKDPATDRYPEGLKK